MITITPPSGISSWAVYSASGSKPARAVIVSLDYRRHVAREGETEEAAMRAATEAFERGEIA